MPLALEKPPWTSALPVAGLAGMALLGGCLLQEPPTASELRDETLNHTFIPAHWSSADTAPGPVQDGWLATFGDATLESLVTEALVHNADLQVAAARVEQARGYAKAAGAAIYPSVTLLARGGGQLSGDNS
ncbi:MAG TPA: TolC family protein, partial [Candidatus Methylomirabilis sp.]|nr:TolC family protein [Candidatus Methylomirabilis sp.]